MRIQLFKPSANSKLSSHIKNGNSFAQVILWTFLISPLLVSLFLGEGRGRIDLILAFNVVTSLLWCGLLICAFKRPLLVHLFLIPIYILTAVDLFILFVFKNRLSSGYIGIALTDYSEFSEFLASYLHPIMLVFGCSLAVCILGFLLLKGADNKPRPKLALLMSVGLIAVYGAFFVRGMSTSGDSASKVLQDLTGKELSVPFGSLFQTGLALYLANEGRELKAIRTSSNLHARQIRKAGGEVYVWIIGESSRPQNWSLFGYNKNTNPSLIRLPGVIQLSNMTTTAPHTSEAVPSMLSLKNITEWDEIQANKSVISAFNQVGIKTYWISTQEVDSWGGALIPVIASEAMRKRYFDRAYDGVLLDELKNILSDTETADRRLIIMHTKGSHWQYSRRYPPSFASSDQVASDDKSRLVNDYDNSIRYTDWIISSVINMLNERGLSSVVLYASDHGENLWDDEKHLFGHAIGNQYDLRTSALFWCSDTMVDRLGSQYLAAIKNAQQPLSIANLSHSMLDAAGISADGFDPTKSIFSSNFTVQHRPYLVRGKLYSDISPGSDN